jgi:hypothetical protein
LNYADPFERFRIGDGEGSWNADPAKRKVLPGSQQDSRITALPGISLIGT